MTTLAVNLDDHRVATRRPITTNPSASTTLIHEAVKRPSRVRRNEGVALRRHRKAVAHRRRTLTRHALLIKVALPQRVRSEHA